MQCYEELRLGECRTSKRSLVFPVRCIVYVKYSISTVSHNTDKIKQLKKQLKNLGSAGSVTINFTDRYRQIHTSLISKLSNILITSSFNVLFPFSDSIPSGTLLSCIKNDFSISLVLPEAFNTLVSF